VPDRRSLVIGVVAAIAAALACAASVQFATPVDRALPFLAVVIVALNAPIAVLPLIVVENVIADEPTRLLAIGIVMALAFAFGARTSRPQSAGVSPDDHGSRARRSTAAGEDARAPLITLLAVLVLRWIPFHNVVLWRELIILAGAVAVAYVMQGATLALLLALFCPAWPAKVAVMLFVIALIAAFQLRRVKGSSVVVALVIAFFPWSGLLARGWGAFLRPPHQGNRQYLGYALKPGSTTTIDVPPDAKAVIVSGANVQRLPCGTILGTLNGKPFTAPDWGFMRREQFFASRNCYPCTPAGRIRDYGWSAWIDGAERIVLPRGTRTIRVDVNPRLPKEATLQVEAFE
jgi:hypothetical protein